MDLPRSNLLELRASQMEKRTEIPIRRAGSPVACDQFLDALASLRPILFSESVSQSVGDFFWIADNHQ